MSKPSKSINAKDVVYGTVNGALIFIARSRAQDLAATHHVLWNATTWGELKARMPAAEYADVLMRSGANDLPEFPRFYREERKGRPSLRRAAALAEYDRRPVAPRAATRTRRPIPRAEDRRSVRRGLPGWPAREMLGWVPKDIQERYATRGFSVINGECLTFEPEREPQVVEAFTGSRLSMRP